MARARTGCPMVDLRTEEVFHPLEDAMEGYMNERIDCTLRGLVATTLVLT